MSQTPDLPNDLRECQQALQAMRECLAQLKAENQSLQQRSAAATQEAETLKRVLDETAASYQELQQEHAATLDELAWYKRWIFGRRRERLPENPGQGHLFDLHAERPSADQEDQQLVAPEPTVEVQPYQRRKKRPIDWDKLPQIRHEHDLPEEEKICSGCQQPMTRIGEDVTRELELIPATLEAHIHVRPKYACSTCKDGVAAAPLPSRPIPGGIAGPGLVSYVVVSKFGDHLPLYRQEDMLHRYGLHIPRSTLCDWVKGVAELFLSLYLLQRQLVLRSSVMWTDDTGVTVLGGPAGSFKGHFWAYLGDDQHPYTVYDFTKNWTRDGPAEFLKDYSGYLHADAFKGYDGIYLDAQSSIIEVACWAHARRKFFEAVRSYPREAHQVVEWIRQLYEIEDRARQLTAEQRRELRVAEATAILARIEAYLEELSTWVLPKSSLGKAVTYARNQWQALCRYPEDGRLTMDNNVSERTLRHQAIGRKNWLFLGSEQAGPRAAVLYTILAGAKRHRLDAWAYVRDLVLRLHGEDTRLEEMLPDRWAATHPESVLTYRLDESREKAARQRKRWAGYRSRRPQL